MPKPLVNLMCDYHLTVSRSQARRLVQQGAVRVNGKTVDSIEAEVEEGSRIEVGRKKEPGA